MIIIGEGLPKNIFGCSPLDPNIPGSAGARLFNMTGLCRMTYLEQFERFNLFLQAPEKWSHVEAKRVAKIILETRCEQLLKGEVVILLGRKVGAAFELMSADFFVPQKLLNSTFYVIPHPSGANRWYNDSSNKQIVDKFWSDIRELIFTQAA